MLTTTTRRAPRKLATLEAVERDLRAGGHHDAVALIRSTGGEVQDVRDALQTLLSAARIHRMPPLPGSIHTRYAWGAPPPTTMTAATPRTGLYDGRELRPYEGRPGAMDAFRLPSLHNGERVPRRAPAIVRSDVREVVR